MIKSITLILLSLLSINSFAEGVESFKKISTHQTELNQLYMQKERCLMLAKLKKSELLKGGSVLESYYHFDIKKCIKLVKKYKQLEK